MGDVVPELNERIMTGFRTRMTRDSRVKQVAKRIANGSATLNDGHTYAAAVGENMSKAMKAAFTPEALPNGKLYYNIADRTVRPAMLESYNLVNDTAAEIQTIVDASTGIGMGAVRAEFPESRIDDLIGKICEDVDNIDNAMVWLTEPIVNNAEGFFDDYVDTNAEVRERSGLKAKITRTAEYNACAWCEDLEGSWDYGDQPDDVYRRHEYCRCSVTYTTEKAEQSVWSKRSWEPKKEDIERRKETDMPAVMSTNERAAVLEQLERDREIAQSGLQREYGRKYAREATLRGRG